MSSVNLLPQQAEGKLNTARSLVDGPHFADAFYLSGYALEIYLKFAAYTNCGVGEIPPEKKQLPPQYRDILWSHDLDGLLSLSGIEAVMKQKHFQDWSFCKKWSPNSRYQTPNITRAETRLLVGKIQGLLEFIKGAISGPALMPLMPMLTDSVVEGLRRAEISLSEKYGQFIFFGLFLHKGAIADRRDLVVSAKWLDNYEKGLQLIDDELQTNLKPEEKYIISEILIFPPSHTLIAGIQRTHCMQTRHGGARLTCGSFGGGGVQYRDSNGLAQNRSIGNVDIAEALLITNWPEK